MHSRLQDYVAAQDASVRRSTHRWLAGVAILLTWLAAYCAVVVPTWFGVTDSRSVRAALGVLAMVMVLAARRLVIALIAGPSSVPTSYGVWASAVLCITAALEVPVLRIEPHASVATLAVIAGVLGAFGYILRRVAPHAT